MKILITGGTGFIGSHLIRAMIAEGHDVVAVRRKNFKLARCADFLPHVVWLEQDVAGWLEQAAVEKPNVIVHAAWAGVTAADRANWKLQSTNLILLAELLELAGRTGCGQFIAFGSQAEYGRTQGRVDEETICRPDTAYGAAKLAALMMLEGFARQNNLNWVWLRLFSIYGLGESDAWFIPGLIRQMKQGQPPQLSGCEQRYDYLHIRDLTAGVLAVLRRPGENGVFNLSSNQSQPLKEVVELIRKYTGCVAEPAYGILPYRPGQSMHIEGDSTRFNATFGFQPQINLAEGLRQLVEEHCTRGELRHTN